MSKSAICTANTSQTALLADSIIPFGSVIHRFGPNIMLNGQAITLCGTGYYKFDCSVTLEPAAIGNVTAQLYLNGEPVQGATATGYASAAGNPVNLSFPTMVRLSRCCEDTASLYVKTDVAATLVNYTATAEKL